MYIQINAHLQSNEGGNEIQSCQKMDTSGMAMGKQFIRDYV